MDFLIPISAERKRLDDFIMVFINCDLGLTGLYDILCYALYRLLFFSFCCFSSVRRLLHYNMKTPHDLAEFLASQIFTRKNDDAVDFFILVVFVKMPSAHFFLCSEELWCFCAANKIAHEISSSTNILFSIQLLYIILFRIINSYLRIYCVS
jgi:transposase-like protein